MYTSFSLPLRRIFFGIAVIGSLFFFSSQAKAQDCPAISIDTGGHHSNAGTEFLVCFMQNEESGFSTATNINKIYISSVSDLPANITITCRSYRLLNQAIILAPRTSTVFYVDQNSVINWPPNDGILNTEEFIDSMVFRVNSDQPITCYGLNAKDFTADAFLSLPKTASGPEYRIMSYYNSMLAGQEKHSEFCVAAFSDGTKVTITTTAPTNNGVQPGTPMKFTLDSGEVVQIQASLNDAASSTYDLTGSTVSVDTIGNKCVAVYGGHSRTEVPSGYWYPDGPDQTSRDYLQDVMPPVYSWGWQFVTKNFGRPDGDLMRVLALNDNTIVTVNGKPWMTLMKNKVGEMMIANSAIAAENVATVESQDSAHPLLVGMIAHTAHSGADPTGDPFLAIVPPVNQLYNDFTYFISTESNFMSDQHYLIIISDSAGIGKGVLGNITVDPGTPTAFTPFVKSYTMVTMADKKKYGIATINQTPGMHRIRSTSGKFAILAYGWGTKISYGYTAGQLFLSKTGMMAKDNHPRPVAPGSNVRIPPEITMRNIMNDRIYLDSAKIRYSENVGNNTVRLAKNIALDIGTLQSAEEKTVELLTSKTVDYPIKGTITIWYHSAEYRDLYPADFPFSIEPAPASASVDDNIAVQAMLENYPNPSHGTTNVHYRIPSRAFVSVKIYDALGRVVRIVSNGITDAEDKNISVSTHGMAPGEYTLELSAPELGVSLHEKLIVIE